MSPQLQLMLQQAIQGFQSGDLDSSALILKRVLQVDAKNLPALHVLGLIKASQENYKEAADILRKAARINPKDASIQYNLAKALSDSGNDGDALSHHKKAVALAPNNPEAWLSYGKTASNLGHYEDALTWYRNALSLRPDYAEASLNIGATLNILKRHEEAIAFAEQAMEINPNLVEAWVNKGVALKELKRFDEAIAHYDRAISLKPDYHEAWANKGIALKELRRYEEAIIHYDKALSLNPSYAEAWSNKGVMLNELRRYEEAIIHYDKALSLNPSYAEAWSNKGLLNLFLKKYHAGWESYNWRLKIEGSVPKMPIEKLSLWNGSNCQHLLIFSEQGIGDVIFYSSMLKCLKSRAKKITVSIDQRLLPILSRSFPGIIFIDSSKALDAQLYDAQIPFGSLAAVLTMHPSMDGRIVPYLTDRDELTKTLKDKASSKNKLKCGVAWKSNNSSIGTNKSVLLSDLNAILKIQNYEFINLQYGDTQEELKNLEKIYGIKLSTIDDINLFENIDGLLSIIKMCDVVVTTSNLTAHLAGALGKSTLLLVPYMTGRIWYWHEEAASSWYPSISIYSQDENLEWSRAIENIAARLKNKLSQ